MKRRNEMAHISVILAELLSGLGMVEPEAEAAVNAPRPGPRNNRDETVVRYEFETPDQTSREATVDRAPAQDEPAHLLDSVRGLTPRAMGKVKKAGAGKAPASSDRGGTSIQLREIVEEMDAHRTHTRPALRLVTGGRELRSDYRRRVEGFPDPALRNSLKLVGGTDHARSFSRTG